MGTSAELGVDTRAGFVVGCITGKYVGSEVGEVGVAIDEF
jgi:hypothetical protein